VPVTGYRRVTIVSADAVPVLARTPDTASRLAAEPTTALRSPDVPIDLIMYRLLIIDGMESMHRFRYRYWVACGVGRGLDWEAGQGLRDLDEVTCTGHGCGEYRVEVLGDAAALEWRHRDRAGEHAVLSVNIIEGWYSYEVEDEGRGGLTMGSDIQWYPIHAHVVDAE
jgi:hypothetical protein